ncbi:winged helix-turn-helix domain-containing protein [Thermus sp.]|uniref:winged helix-turn-helix domain-containing protein n=1 Tax=Thermus sp. TaxID=275 RepID=UPI00307CE24F
MELAKHRRRPRLELKLRHHPDNLWALYRESQDPVERARWHAIWLLATGHSIPEVAQTLGYTTRWVRMTIRRYNQDQPLADLRHQLRDGLWTIRNAAEWLSGRLGRPVDPRRAWVWMKRLGFAPLRPRPRHREGEAERQEAFKKTSSSSSSS